MFYFVPLFLIGSLVKGWTVSDSCMQKLRDKGHKIERLGGYQFKYIYFIDKKIESNLTKPIIPFSEIDKQGAGMYKGEKITLKERKENKRD